MLTETQLEQIPEKPYPGLRPFNEQESAIFFGRELTIFELIAKMGERNLIIVHGGSGCGKSSIVNAGVIPTLLRDHTLANLSFDYGVYRPFKGPIDGMAKILADHLGSPTGDDPFVWWVNQLVVGDNIVDVIERQIESKGLESFCLVIDQFEEIFAWADEISKHDAQLLINLLAEIGSRENKSKSLFVLLTMRSDFLGRCVQFPGLNKLINDCQYFLPNLDDRGVYKAITEPAKIFEGSVSSELADKLRYAVQGGQDPLPVLQHALMRMADTNFQDDCEWEMSTEDLEEIGGLDSAISMHADQIYNRLIDQNGAEMESGISWFFRALVENDAGGVGRRRPRNLYQLNLVTGLDRTLLLKIVEEFSAPGCSFLKTSNSGVDRDSIIVDISHEALIRNWWRMHDSNSGDKLGWLSLERQAQDLWRYFALSAQDHAENDGSLLPPAITEFRWPWYDPLQRLPERARRYFQHAQEFENADEEPEWEQVSSFMDASYRRMENAKKRKWGLAAAFPIVAGALAYWAITAQTSADVSIKDLANTKIEKQDELIESDKVFGAFLQDTVNSRDENLSVNQLDVGKMESIEGTLGEELKKQDATVTIFDPNLESRYYIWIGTQARPEIAYDLESCKLRKIRPETVKKNQRFVVCSNIIVRNDFPEPGKKIKGVGVATYGTTVMALDKPLKYRDQYWINVMVRPTNFPDVSIRYSWKKEKWNALENGLKNIGYEILDSRRRANRGGEDTVTYCKIDDKSKAVRLAASVDKLMLNDKGSTKTNLDCTQLDGANRVLLNLG